MAAMTLEVIAGRSSICGWFHVDQRAACPLLNLLPVLPVLLHVKMERPAPSRCRARCSCWQWKPASPAWAPACW